MNPHRWLREHSLKLLAIRDTPVAIAGGVAIGIFFGFTPLFGLKTLLAIFFAWLTGSNILAAVLASALHDIVLPLMPPAPLAQSADQTSLGGPPWGWLAEHFQNRQRPVARLDCCSWAICFTCVFHHQTHGRKIPSKASFPSTF